MNEHNEATLKDHLEMTWAALVSTKKELDSLKDLRQKFDESEEKKQGLKKSMETCQAEIHYLTQALDSVNLNQREMMNDLKREMTDELERKMEEGLEKIANKAHTLKRRPSPTLRFNPDDIINEPSMSDVHQGPAETTPRRKIEVRVSDSSLSKLSLSQTREEPGKSFSPKEEIPFRTARSRFFVSRKSNSSSPG